MNSNGTLKAAIPSSVDPRDRGRALERLRADLRPVTHYRAPLSVSDNRALRAAMVGDLLTLRHITENGPSSASQQAQNFEQFFRAIAARPQATVPLSRLDAAQAALSAQRTLGNRLLAENDRLKGELAKVRADLATVTQRQANQANTIASYQKSFGGLPSAATAYATPPEGRQSEDRAPKSGYYIVVSQEHRDEGMVHYVQHPNGKRNSVRTKTLQKAINWAIHQEETRCPYGDPNEYGAGDRIVE